MTEKITIDPRGSAAFCSVAADEKRPLLGFQSDGYVRLSAILKPFGPLPIRRSTWWKGVKEGRYPQPIKLGPRITAWRVSDIVELIDNIIDGSIA